MNEHDDGVDRRQLLGASALAFLGAACTFGGAGEATARSLLTYAFANDVLNRIRLEPVRVRLEQALLTRLPEGESIRESL